MRFIKLLHGFMSLFPCPSQHSLRSSNLTIGLVLEELAWQGLVPIGHKSIFLSDFKIWKWFCWLWVLIIILNNLYSQSKNVGTRSLFNLVKVPQGMFLNLGARGFELQRSISCSPSGIFEWFQRHHSLQRVIKKSLQKFQGVFMWKKLGEEERLQVIQMNTQFYMSDFKWS